MWDRPVLGPCSRQFSNLGVVFTDMDGSPYLGVVFTDMDGSPYLGVVFTDMDGSPYSSASQMHTLTPFVLGRTTKDTDSIMNGLKCKAWRK